ncbi:MAG: phosphotransferase family protein [Pseudomonadota bacterium]
MNNWIVPLAEFFSSQLGTTAKIEALSRIVGGHSRGMYRLEIQTDTVKSYVLRIEQGGVFGTQGASEFRLMQALSQAGAPVAPVCFEETTGELLGEPFFVMEFVEGEETLPDTGVLKNFVRTLQRFHQLDWKTHALPFAPARDTAEAVDQQITRWQGVYQEASSHAIPLLDEAAAWLHYNHPALNELQLVHGDAGPGNFIHADGNIRALTDFEFCHLGDPAEDWVFCAIMRGLRVMTTEQWRGFLSETADINLSDEQWHYWRAFNLFKGACANITALDVFQSGRNPAPNMYIVGTALHQSFLRQLTTLIAP